MGINTHQGYRCDISGDIYMEIIDVMKYNEFKKGAVFKAVPMLTDQTMASILLVDSDSMTTDLNHPQKDRIYYVVSGAGRVTIGHESKLIREGHLILIPKGKSHKYATTGSRLVLISVNQIDDKVIKKKPAMKKMR
jgi:mannose-6-phosphate isomerase-like protein (cupin superfamily)